MLPKQHRLSLRPEITRLKKTGRMIPGRYFSLLYSLGGDTGPPRFAFIVSKKIDNRATVRNRVRRLLSEAVREQLPGIKSGAAGVFLTKKSIAGQNLEEIINDVRAVFSHAHLFTNE